jgi:hypothetical protein
MADDWRVRLRFEDESSASGRAENIEAAHIERDIARRMGERIAVSRDGAELFLYADDEDAARAADHFVRAELADDSWEADVELSRWHDEAEDWEPADRPLPRTEHEHRAERERLMRREDRETAEQGYADWEVRVALPNHHAARVLSHRLAEERVPHVRRWKYVLVGATDEDAARQWEDRLRSEAPEGTNLRVEGTFGSMARNNPFAVLSGLSGGP